MFSVSFFGSTKGQRTQIANRLGRCILSRCTCNKFPLIQLQRDGRSARTNWRYRAYAVSRYLPIANDISRSQCHRYRCRIVSRIRSALFVVFRATRKRMALPRRESDFLDDGFLIVSIDLDGASPRGRTECYCNLSCEPATHDACHRYANVSKRGVPPGNINPNPISTRIRTARMAPPRASISYKLRYWDRLTCVR